MHSENYREQLLKYIRLAYGYTSYDAADSTALPNKDYRTEKSVATINDLKRSVGVR